MLCLCVARSVAVLVVPCSHAEVCVVAAVLWGWGSPDVSMSHPYVVLSWPPQLQLTAQPSGSLVQGWAQIWPRAEGLEVLSWVLLQTASSCSINHLYLLILPSHMLCILLAPKGTSTITHILLQHNSLTLPVLP
ncbi:hypothetical protein ABBQ32_006308 [Trebouxia sp. C0010 RCD-2024]